jgi:hypothetical protein
MKALLTKIKLGHIAQLDEGGSPKINFVINCVSIHCYPIKKDVGKSDACPSLRMMKVVN